ncbi:unnamed protein product [Blepharisma stoltei]|uniref:Magnesium transporter n=1 Tax=Blepharisma stoltei TaxID=1481888 RepID=A0AAU9JZS3_9CILI|nr:unnamed protein product [Blepharisma stoltei]
MGNSCRKKLKPKPTGIEEMKSKENSEKDNLQIILFNLNQNSYQSFSLSEALSLNYLKESEDESWIMLLKNTNDDDLLKIIKSFELHPIINYELGSTSVNQNQFISFDDYFLLSINDFSTQLSSPSTVKLLIWKKFMMIFCTEFVYALQEILKNYLNYTPIQQAESDSSSANERPTLELEEEYHCSVIEAIYYKIFELTLRHHEFLAQMVEEEAKMCLQSSNESNLRRRLDYVPKLSVVEKQLIFMKDLIKPKTPVLLDLLHSKKLSQSMSYYFWSLKSRIKDVKRKAKSCAELLKNAEHIYNSMVEFDISKNNNSISESMKYFSAISTMFLLIAFVDGAFGMNISLPGGDEDNYWPLATIFLFCIADVVILFAWFKLKKWI